MNAGGVLGDPILSYLLWEAGRNRTSDQAEATQCKRHKGILSFRLTCRW